MDFAIFVVHAHESRLSINEENAGISYAMFYRTLMEKTGEFSLINRMASQKCTHLQTRNFLFIYSHN